ncbi:DoxX family protein [Dongia soli]|uniref:DoxX family protein n=1 Tax=Dongia soli TaxID=600628 RepID=UPI002A6A026E|nr:DoxX family protein [Dongia soli]
MLGHISEEKPGLQRLATSPAVYWIALLALCGAYLQGGITKALDFQAAVAEMAHFGLEPAQPFALAVIVLELGASFLILAGFYRWIGALALAGFTAMAAFLANAFWLADETDRLRLMNAFMEHFGLAGGFILVAWHDIKQGIARTRS